MIETIKQISKVQSELDGMIVTMINGGSLDERVVKDVLDVLTAVHASVKKNPPITRAVCEGEFEE